MKVLIVDDSAVIRKRLVEIISEIKGVELVGQAKNIDEARNIFQKKKPEGVILDIRLLGGNGIDVLKNIKKDNPATKVIMLTNYPYPQYRKRCMDAGADFFFDKSKEFERIPEVFKQFIENS